MFSFITRVDGGFLGGCGGGVVDSLIEQLIWYGLSKLRPFFDFHRKHFDQIGSEKMLSQSIALEAIPPKKSW